jgi:hypothetical protein
LEAAAIISPCDPEIVAARIKRADRRPQGWDLNLSLVRDDLDEAEAAIWERQLPGRGARFAAARLARYGRTGEVQPPHPGPDGSGAVDNPSRALLQMGDRTWQWLDSWELGVTQPLMQRGDSGALAIDPTATPYIFGHFVGGNVALRGTGFTHHWVQDLGQVLARLPVLNSMIAF